MGSVLAALACLRSRVQGPVTLVAAWLLAGAAMAMTLYDPAFATLHHVAGLKYRASVTGAHAVRWLREHRVLATVAVVLEREGFRTAFSLRGVASHGLPAPARPPRPARSSRTARW